VRSNSVVVVIAARSARRPIRGPMGKVISLAVKYYSEY
jgi:hypothetical protein